MADMEKVVKGIEICLKDDGCKGCPYYKHDNAYFCGIMEILTDALELLKSKPQKGHWVEKEDYNLDTYYDCSVCGESWTTIEGTQWDNGMNFCPHCGADMREGEHDA